MGLMASSFVIMIAVALSNFIGKGIPGVASSYINILVGVGIAAIPVLNTIVPEFNDEVFMLLIIAPLLFFEGQLTPIQRVKARMSGILGTAVGLALASAVVIALVLHQLGLAFPLALMIAAISTPTDATAFDSVAEARVFPKQLKDRLRLESLFNDATGIILLQAGVLWAVTGHLAFTQNVQSFLYAAIGGIVIGAGAEILLMLIRQYLVRTRFDVVSSQALIYFLTPFMLYLVAEAVHVSPIIAVVSGGLMHNSEASRSRFASPRQSHFSKQFTDFATQILNGFVFVVLGISLERVIASGFTTMFHSLTWIGVGLAVYVFLLVSRYVYARLFVRTSRREAHLFALGGVHGTITLAMTFSIMSAGVSRSTFNFVIMVETVVIILSMLVPTILFKIILPLDFDLVNRRRRLQAVREEMVAEGMGAINDLGLSPIALESVQYDLYDQIGNNSLAGFLHQWRTVSNDSSVYASLRGMDQQRALMVAFQAERAYLLDQVKRHILDEETANRLYGEVLLSESMALDPKNRIM